MKNPMFALKCKASSSNKEKIFTFATLTLFVAAFTAFIAVPVYASGTPVDISTSINAGVKQVSDVLKGIAGGIGLASGGYGALQYMLPGEVSKKKAITSMVGAGVGGGLFFLMPTLVNFAASIGGGTTSVTW